LTDASPNNHEGSLDVKELENLSDDSDPSQSRPKRTFDLENIYRHPLHKMKCNFLEWTGFLPNFQQAFCPYNNNGGSGSNYPFNMDQQRNSHPPPMDQQPYNFPPTNQQPNGYPPYDQQYQNYQPLTYYPNY